RRCAATEGIFTKRRRSSITRGTSASILSLRASSTTITLPLRVPFSSLLGAPAGFPWRRHQGAAGPAALGRNCRDVFTVRPITNADALRRCVDLQMQIWGMDAGGAVPDH